MRSGVPGAALSLLPLMVYLLLLTGTSSGSKLRAPELSAKGKEYVIQAEQTLYLACRGGARIAWTLPETLNTNSKRLVIVKYACGKTGKQFCSNLTLSGAYANETGYYSCKYSSSSSSLVKKKKMESQVYIFINDTAHPFVKMHNEIPMLVYMSEGKALIIPCRVTSPNITVTLKKYRLETLQTDGKTVIWDNKKGFIVPKPTYKFIGLLSCETTVNGHLHSTKYMTHRQVNEIHDVRLGVLNPIKLLQGESLVMNCTVKAAWNTRAQIKWSYPGEGHQRAKIHQRLYQIRDNTIYSRLFIDKVCDSDKGLYVCLVKSGDVAMSVNTTVQIYEKAFITVKRRREGMLEAMAGQKSYRLAMKVKAFPSPEVIWYKDDLLAAEKCARYIVNDNILTIKDVSEEDTGRYTIVLRIPQWNLTRSLSSTLTVNVKPQIYEKSVSFQDPHLYPLGSKQDLTCTVYGVPPPAIKWIWHPCGHNFSKPWCDFHSSLEKSSFLLKSGSTKGNPISISERMQIIEGKNKTVSVLAVAESKASGVYSCVATNKIGKDRRNVNFYVTDLLHGFHISLDKVPTEGDNITVSCTVNKFLYTDISWSVQRTIQNRTITHKISDQSNSLTGEYSTTQTFLIKNASQEDSGTYICQAKNIHSREEVLHRKDITIRGEHRNKKALLSWTTKCKGTRNNCTTQSIVKH